MSQLPAFKGLKQLFPLRLCRQNHPGNLEKYRFPGPSQRHRFRHWGGRLVTLIQSVVMVMLWGPTPCPPQPTRPQRLNQLKAPQGGAQMTTLEHPIYYSGHAVPRTQRIIFRVGRALPGSPFTKGTRRVPVPGRHRGGPAEPGEGPEPPRALARSRGHSAGGRSPASSPGPTPSSCSLSGRREGRAGRERRGLGKTFVCGRGRPGSVQRGPAALRPGRLGGPRLRAGSRRRAPPRPSRPPPRRRPRSPRFGETCSGGRARARLAGQGRPLVPSGACCRPAAGGGPEQDGELPSTPRLGDAEGAPRLQAWGLRLG